MDRRQKKRILIFLVVPILAIFLFITDDTLIRVITLALLLIYIAFIIFLRDSLRFEDSFDKKDLDADISGDRFETKQAHVDESFKIISRKTNPDVITAENYRPEFHGSRVTLKPPDLKEKFEEIANESFPSGMGHNGQFSFVLEKMLTVIKEVYSAHTAIFFWYHKNKEKLSIEKFNSGSNDIANRKFDLEDDILSKIVQRGEPELLSDISPAAEADVIRYYNSAQGIRSFVGVPLFYDKSLIAIIAVDSKVGDAFGIETIYALGRFVRVLTMLITIFEEKHSETVSQQRLKALLNLIGPDNKLDNEQELIRTLHESVSLLIPWDAFAFVFYDPIEKQFKTVKVVNNTSLKYIGEGLVVDISGTLVGKSIVTGIPVKIDDTSSGGYKRFSTLEDVSFDGSFLAIPLVYQEQNYGVLCFESLKKNVFTNSDVQFLRSSLNIISFVIYSYSSQKLLKSYIAFDIETRALNSDTFKERLSADLIKSEQLKIPGAIVLIRIDDFLEQDSLFDGNPFPKVLTTISETIAKEMNALNILGRLDEKVFAVYFFNSTTKDVFIWAEKLRVKVARKPIAVVSKQTTYTISVGVASTTNKLNVDEVIHNADLALQKAVERGGNTVKNIN